MDDKAMDFMIISNYLAYPAINKIRILIFYSAFKNTASLRISVISSNSFNLSISE